MLMKDPKYRILAALAVPLFGGRGHQECLQWEVFHSAVAVCWERSLDPKVL